MTSPWSPGAAGRARAPPTRWHRHWIDGMWVGPAGALKQLLQGWTGDGTSRGQEWVSSPRVVPQLQLCLRPFRASSRAEPRGCSLSTRLTQRGRALTAPHSLPACWWQAGIPSVAFHPGTVSSWDTTFEAHSPVTGQQPRGQHCAGAAE